MKLSEMVRRVMMAVDRFCGVEFDDFWPFAPAVPRCRLCGGRMTGIECSRCGYSEGQEQPGDTTTVADN